MLYGSSLVTASQELQLSRTITGVRNLVKDPDGAFSKFHKESLQLTTIISYEAPLLYHNHNTLNFFLEILKIL